MEIPKKGMYHYKTKYYDLIAVSNLENRIGWIPTVTYKCRASGKYFSRPLSEWNARPYALIPNDL